MITAQMVGSVFGNYLDDKYLGGSYGKITERIDRAKFYYALGKAIGEVIFDDGKELAEEIAEEIRELVPVDTGELRDSVRVVKGENGYEIHVGGTPETMKPMTAGGPETFDLALAIEYGTTKRTANPFFWPVIRIHEDRIEKILGKNIEEKFS
jgi:hypothetical protein